MTGQNSIPPSEGVGDKRSGRDSSAKRSAADDTEGMAIVGSDYGVKAKKNQ